MTPDPIPPIPAPLTLQQRAEMACEAHRLLKAIRDDNTWHGRCATYEQGQGEANATAACDAAWLLAYRTELAHKMDVAATLAQVEARA